MTFETKRQLREKCDSLNRRLLMAVNKLDSLGFERRPGDPDFAFWTESTAEKLRQDEQARRRIEDRKAEEHKNRDKGTREALELVINALELREYGHQGGGIFPTPYVPKTVDDFKADLETAIHVREEKAKATADQATANKVTRLTKASPWVGSFSFVAADEFDPTNPKLSDLLQASTAKPQAKSAKSKKKSKGDSA